MNTNWQSTSFPADHVAGAPFKPTYVDVTEQALFAPAPSQPQYHIMVKRNDLLYRVLSFLNTIFSILGVLLILATFIMVCYGVVVLSQVVEVVEVIKNQRVP